MEMTVSNRMDGSRCKVRKEGRKGVAFENVQKEKDYRKDILHRGVGNETRKKSAADCSQIWCLLPSSPCHRSPPLTISLTVPSSPEGLMEQRSFSDVFLFTAFVALLPGQHFTSVLKTYYPFNSTRRFVWKDLFQMFRIVNAFTLQLLFRHPEQRCTLCQFKDDLTLKLAASEIMDLYVVKLQFISLSPQTGLPQQLVNKSRTDSQKNSRTPGIPMPSLQWKAKPVFHIFFHLQKSPFVIIA